MSKAKPTPGPWEITKHGKAVYIRFFVGKHGLPASATGYAEFSVQPYIRPDEAEANAQLIAAAPEMAKALKRAETVLSDPNSQTTEQIWDVVLKEIRAALTKAGIK